MQESCTGKLYSLLRMIRGRLFAIKEEGIFRDKNTLDRSISEHEYFR